MHVIDFLQRDKRLFEYIVAFKRFFTITSNPNSLVSHNLSYHISVTHGSSRLLHFHSRWPPDTSDTAWLICNHSYLIPDPHAIDSHGYFSQLWHSSCFQWNCYSAILGKSVLTFTCPLRSTAFQLTRLIWLIEVLNLCYNYRCSMHVFDRSTTMLKL